MSDRTEFNPTAVEKAAKELTAMLAARTSAFDMMNGPNVGAGAFAAGDELGRALEARQAGLMNLKKQLDLIAERESAGLRQAARVLTNQDDGNASGVGISTEGGLDSLGQGHP